MSRWFLTLLITLPAPAFASTTNPDVKRPDARPVARAEQLTVDKGTEITIEDYDAKTDTFLLSLVAEPAVGPNFVTPEMLRRGVAFTGDQRDFMKQKNQMIGSIFQVKQPLPLVREDEMEQRKKAARGKRAF